ncbi:hypothetical protein HDV05_004261 [Chytridiales sp. JEL 0842]|nr:hypothetical protein HDV05_004261 [Chytridiales sp. JEL 0842]
MPQIISIVLATAAFTALVANPANAQYVSGGFTFSGVSKDATTTTVTVKGPLAANNWIGFGVPPATSPGNLMENADLFVIYTDGTTGSVITGRGDCSRGCNFVPGPSVNIASGNTTAQYAAGAVTFNIDIPSTFVAGGRTLIWATGRMSGTTPSKHTNTGSFKANQLVSGGTGTTTGTGTGTTGTGTGKSAASREKAGGFAVGLAAALFGLIL